MHLSPNIKPYLSIILPIYNEEKSLPILMKEIDAALINYKNRYEIIAVNDASKDGSYKVLQELAQGRQYLKVINFRVNGGQTAAFAAGFAHASGSLFITSDSDLENDPKDMPKLIAKIEEGYDLVSGWRKNRWQGQALKRKVPSLIANSLISKITGVKLNDYGCMLKVYKREVIDGVRLYGEMHRFIPAYVKKQGRENNRNGS